MIKVLNLYAGIGGNRKLWKDVEVTAVEINPDIAKIYHDLFPNDNVIVNDAHEYLLQHSEEYDFIWTSPPCQTHSSFRQNICVRYRGTKPKFPNLKLYEEILFLKYNSKCLWIVENVKPYYKYLIEPNVVLGRHPFWCNFVLLKQEFTKDNIRKSQIPQLQVKYDFNLAGLKLKNKRQVLRNCVDPEIGLYVLDTIKGKYHISNYLDDQISDTIKEEYLRQKKLIEFKIEKRLENES